MENKTLIDWLVEGDVSIQYQTQRDLLDSDRIQLQKKIANQGWGAELLAKRNKNGHWGRGFYQPKWISTHYTLLDLRNLNIAVNIREIHQTLALIFRHEKGGDGGINPGKTINNSDACINGMVLNYASYFNVQEKDLVSLIDFLLSQQLSDGGFNCQYNRKGAVHSSLHTTLSIAEGIHEYLKNGYTYKKAELTKIQADCHEFILRHRLYKSDKTGEIINKKFLMLPYPPRWYYDILKALDYFQYAGLAYDSRMDGAIEVILKKQRKDGKWPIQAKHPGQTHFDMEQAGTASRWNTLRVLRIFRHFHINTKNKE